MLAYPTYETPQPAIWPVTIILRRSRLFLCPWQLWWRSQAAAYIIRPNAPTIAAMSALRMNASMAHVWRNGRLEPNLSMPYPLPPGTISMHVRQELSQAPGV